MRGLSKPYVGASFISDSQEIRVWKTALVDDSSRNTEPGKVIQVGTKMVVKCGEGAIALLVIEPSFEPRLGGLFMRTIVIAPHPNDEVLSLGGTLLRRKAEGASIDWMIVMAISVQHGWTDEKSSSVLARLGGSVSCFN